jgi:hypothetical protein
VEELYWVKGLGLSTFRRDSVFGDNEKHVSHTKKFFFQHRMEADKSVMACL